MSQNDFNIANQGFPATRADMNSALQALASNSSGDTEPSTTYAYQWWYDSTADVLKMRNADNDAWISFASFDQASDTWSIDINGGTIDGTVIGGTTPAAGTFTTFTSTGIDDNATSTAITIDSSENVGIGTSSPVYPLDLAAPSNIYARFASANSAAELTITSPTTNLINIGAGSGDALSFSSNASEAMRIDSSGNLLVGTTSTNTLANSGFIVQPDGQIFASSESQQVLTLTRRVDDGEIARFRNSIGSTVGSIGVNGDRLYMATDSDTGFAIDAGANNLFPSTDTGGLNDNFMDLGVSSSRWDDIYATNGTIQTSDRNEKQDIEVLFDAETRVAQACKGLLRKFRWKDAVAEKGDDARIHFGIIAQDLRDAFTAEGLDAGRYAMFISSTWWETQTEVPAVEAVEAVEATYDEDGNEITPAVEAVEAKEAYTRTDTYETQEEAPEGATERTRLGVRYPELLAFIIAAI